MIAEIAGRQRGVVSRTQLVGAGLSKHEVDWRVRTGHLHQLFRGVYLVGHEVPVLGAREFAGTLAGGDGTVVFGMSAALTFESISGYDGPVEIAADRHIRPREGLRPYRRRLEPGELGTWQGLIPITSPARTIVDIAPRLKPRQLERAVADAIRRKLTSVQELERLIERYQGRPGIPALKAILNLDKGPAYTRSDAEADLLDLIRRAGLPIPETNYTVEGRERDFVYPRHRLIIELDSSFHDDPVAQRVDPERDAELLLTGWRTLRIRTRQVKRQPHRVVALIAANLSRLDSAPRSA